MKNIEHFKPCARTIVVLLIVFICGCRDGMKSKTENELLNKYSLGDIEARAYFLSSATSDEKLNNAYVRFSLAGPTVLPEVLKLLNSDNDEIRHMGGYCLHELCSKEKWPGIFDVVLNRLEQPLGDRESGQLLLAIAHDGIKDNVKAVSIVERYLNNITYVMTISNGRKSQDLRICDLATYILQEASGANFGAYWHSVSDEALGRARKWRDERHAKP